MRLALTLAVAVACLGLPATGGAATFSNPAPLGPADNAPLEPYPSPIAVSGQQGTITSVTASLVGLGGAAMRDLDALLVGPGGRTMLLSDPCSNGIIPDWTGQTMTLDDRVGTAIPDSCPPGSFPSGAYRPADYTAGLADDFPGVSPPYPVSLAAFNGRSPNGVWSLYVVDDNPADALTVGGGWRLDLTTTGANKKKCKKKKAKKKSAAAAKKKKGCKKKKKK